MSSLDRTLMLRIFFTAFLSFFTAPLTQADQAIHGYQIENNGTQVQVYQGEYENDAQAEEIAQGISDEYFKAKSAHPSAEMFMELSTVEADTEGREPSSQAGSRSLIDRIEGLLKRKGAEASEARLALDTKDNPMLRLFLKSEKWNYVVIKVSAVFGLEYFMVMTGKGSQALFLEAATAAAGAALLTSLTTKQLGWFQNKWRIQNTAPFKIGAKSVKQFFEYFQSNSKALSSPEASTPSQFSQKLSSVGKIVRERFDHAHMMVNYWITEYAFGDIIRKAQAFIYLKNGVSHQEGSLLEFSWNVTISTFSQGEWDRGVFRYVEYLESIGVKERQREVVRFALSTVGSVVSIGGFTFLNLNLGIASTATGYAFLGALRYGGVKFNQLIDKKTAVLALESAENARCDGIMSGKTETSFLFLHPVSFSLSGY